MSNRYFREGAVGAFIRIVILGAVALSGGCVRQTTDDAIWMWNWAGLGTTVVVL